MKNIAVYLVGKADNGGSYQYWRAVLKALSQLDNREYKVRIYSPFSDWGVIAGSLQMSFEVVNPYLNLLQKICIYIFPRFLPKAIIKKFSIIYNPFVRKMKKNKPDLWIGQTTEIGGDILDVPTIAPIFDLMHRYRKDIKEVSERYIEREKLYTYLCRHAAMLLVDSEVGKQHVIECYGNLIDNLSDKIRILPFIPPDYIYEKKSKTCEEAKDFPKYFFYPAQFWTHKNHVKLLKAVKLLKEKGITVNFIFVGSEQNNEKAISSLVVEYGLVKQIKILGYVSNEEMVYLYQNARALVMPTLFGPTNIPQLEAFELGCPVATSRIYAIPEQVGDAALLFDPESVEEIASTMEQLWTDDELCRRLAEKGKKRSALWGQEQFSERLLQYIKDYFRKDG